MYILDIYLSKLSPEPIEKDNFYVQPVAKFVVSQSCFTARPIGKNKLGSMVKEFCSNAGISGCKTNHSLRVTGVSDLFQAGVPEKIIKERSGHLSTDGLCHYQRTTTEQDEHVSKILASGSSYVSICESHNYIPQPSYSPTVQNFSSCNVNIYNAPFQPNVPFQQNMPFNDSTNTHRTQQFLTHCV